jgi:hypothetical protein
MNFNEYIIDQDDYEFFDSLPKDEKILFLYDLICDDIYGIGSINSIPEDTTQDLNEPTKNIKDELPEVVAKSINEFSKVNILVIDNNIILNSDSKKYINEVIHDMINDGCILSKYVLSKRSLLIFKQQKYCQAYSIIGKELRICKN